MRSLIIFCAFFCALSFASESKADIYIYRDSNGVLHFTNVPTHQGYRPFIKDPANRSPVSSFAPGRLEELIRSASDRYSVDQHLVRAVMRVESNFNSQARSRKGAQGLMQLMPETARLHNVANAYDPEENVDGGVRHLRYLLDHYQGDLPLTLAAYNAGIKAVEKHNGVPPYPETKEYIRRVLDHHQRYRGSGTVSIKEMARR